MQKNLRDNDLKFIGKGSFSRVYSKKINGKTYALKLLTSNSDCNSEIDHLDQVGKHENIIKRYKNKTLISHLTHLENFIILELCEGSLHDWKSHDRKNKSYRDETILKQIVKGMIHIHSMDIVHGDLTPRNILLKNGKVKIADFGLSSKNGASKFGNDVCTPGFRAPEYISYQPCTVRKSQDVWSFGCILIYLTQKNFYGFQRSILFSEGPELNFDYYVGALKNVSINYMNNTMACLKFDPLERPSFLQIQETI